MYRRDVLCLLFASTVSTTFSVKKTSVRTPAQVFFQAENSGKRESITINWERVISKTSKLTFGSNDYQVLNPQDASDLMYQKRLLELKIGLYRIHHASLSDHWSDANQRNWNSNRIKTSYDAAPYLNQATIIQNINGWPKWMQQDKEGLLDHSEYETYAKFCAELVNILNKHQHRQIIYWEPLNEQDMKFFKAKKLDKLWKLFNLCVEEMKKVDPLIKVGGPVLTYDNINILKDFLEVCGHNTDFISWHRYGSGNANESTETIMDYTPKYGDQVREIRETISNYNPNNKISLLLGEYNINYSWQSGEMRQNTHIGAVWFASVLKHLSDAGIDMATSWHLKDGVYGMIDPNNNLRLSAKVFEWGIKYLIGDVIYSQSSNPLIESLIIQKTQNRYTLLLINKSDTSAQVNLNLKENTKISIINQIFSLDEKGIKEVNIKMPSVDQKPLFMRPYSVKLLLAA